MSWDFNDFQKSLNRLVQKQIVSRSFADFDFVDKKDPENREEGDGESINRSSQLW